LAKKKKVGKEKQERRFWEPSGTRVVKGGVGGTNGEQKYLYGTLAGP